MRIAGDGPGLRDLRGPERSMTAADAVGLTAVFAALRTLVAGFRGAAAGFLGDLPFAFAMMCSQQENDKQQ
jgi:hypothetical protein